MKPSKVRYDILFLIIAIAVSPVVIKSGLDRYDSLKGQEDRLIKEKTSGEIRKKALLSKLKDLGADSHVEMVARRRLCYVKNGEQAYKIIVKN